ncbi:hypothetical protein DFH28DRAFT_910459 [Melampsora americana]|nr:hypothetical protein DFH28DRAFT_910459 [Melampsora americana]
MDGNFQHRHNVLASKDNPDESQYPSIFVRPSAIAKHDDPNQAPPPRDEEDLNDPCGESHKTANDTRNSSTWDQCDDTGLFALACRHDVPLLLANIYQTGEKLYYPLSLIQSLLDDFPELRVGILYDIGCQLDKHIKKQNKIPEYQRRIVLGTSVFHAYVHSWGCQLHYNPRFLDFWGLSDGEGLKRLWSDLTPLIARLRTLTRLHRLHRANFIQQHSSGLNGTRKGGTILQHLKTSRRARSLRLENFSASKIACIRFDTQQELRAFDRLQRFQDLATQITEQRKKVGTSDILNTLTLEGQDLFLKVWFAKTEVRTRFLALRAEQRPLDPENKVGGSSRLGTHEKERIMLAIEKRTRTMKKTLTNYNRLAREFQNRHPDQPASPAIEYSDLIHMEADNPFWNNVQRGHEELRRLGWEVRRSMRWAVAEHERLWPILNHLKNNDDPGSELIQHFMNNDTLQSLSISGRIQVVKGLLHNLFVKMSRLALYWDSKAMQVMMKTPAQLGDLALMTLWKTQRNRIVRLRSSGYGSIRHGDFDHLFGPVRLDDIIHRPQESVEDIVDQHQETIGEAEWENRIDAGMLITMMQNVGLEEDKF